MIKKNGKTYRYFYSVDEELCGTLITNLNNNFNGFKHEKNKKSIQGNAKKQDEVVDNNVSVMSINKTEESDVNSKEMKKNVVILCMFLPNKKKNFNFN